MLEYLSEQAISVPAEWAPQKAIWTAWPADAEEWNGDLASPRRDVAALVRALAPSNQVRLLVAGGEAEASARAALEDAAELIPARYGDIWLRDTGPIFARTATGPIALRFQTNGWGGKFDLPDDATVGDEIARLARTPARKFDFVLEGGAVEHDGEGTFLATRETLLNANRNGWTEAQAEAALVEAFGARKIVWLDRGLLNDHTDGHIDVLARLVGPARVVCQSPYGADDPNADVLAEVARTLEAATDALGRRFELVRMPSPGRVVNELGDALPASHMNFVIANGVVAVPVYGTPSAARAVEALQAVFRDRKVVGLPSLGLLGSGSAGGGSFHCITREEPA
ncbi:MAG TPA: agmatine deiminase family protein [Methyloceanibacter sp.]|jgi:agmatine deiminase|nr:agmatine deiminase family protein [Methyloceanibacter sp.]